MWLENRPPGTTRGGVSGKTLLGNLCPHCSREARDRRPEHQRCRRMRRQAGVLNCTSAGSARAWDSRKRAGVGGTGSEKNRKQCDSAGECGSGWEPLSLPLRCVITDSA